MTSLVMGWVHMGRHMMSWVLMGSLIMCWVLMNRLMMTWVHIGLFEVHLFVHKASSGSMSIKLWLI